MSGDPRQAEPVADEPMFKRGQYVGKALNKPRNDEAPAGAPSMEQLVNRAELFRQEYECADGDAVILREAHRIDRGEGRGLSGEGLERFRKDAEKFQEVTGRMASCEWSRVEHAWLAGRNRSRLSAEEVRRFEDAPLLMDGKKKKSDGEDGADQMNARELVKLAAREDRPILRVKSIHD